MLQPKKVHCRMNSQIVKVSHILSLIRSPTLYAILIRRQITVGYIRVRAGL
jgi:hypothetical protein